jgi:hypothetical protein
MHVSCTESYGLTRFTEGVTRMGLFVCPNFIKVRRTYLASGPSSCEVDADVDFGGIRWGDPSLSGVGEAQCGEWYEARGRRVVEHRGRLWVKSRRCFFQPVHHLAKRSTRARTQKCYQLTGRG